MHLLLLIYQLSYQGQPGNQFYIIMSGSVGVYIQQQAPHNSISTNTPQMFKLNTESDENEKQLHNKHHQHHNHLHNHQHVSINDVDKDGKLIEQEDHINLQYHQVHHDHNTPKLGPIHHQTNTIEMQLYENTEFQQIKILQSGQYFGEIALITDGPRTATIITETKCTCLVLSKLEFKNLLLKSEQERMIREMGFFLSLDFLGHWDFNKIQLLYSNLFKLKIKKGEYVYQQGDVANNMYIIQKGEFIVEKTFTYYKQANLLGLLKEHNIFVDHQIVQFESTLTGYKEHLAKSNQTSKQVQLFTLVAHDIFGQQQLMKTRTRKVSVKCITNEAELLIINRKLFNERLRYDTFCHEYFTQRAKTKNANLRSQLNSVKQGWYTIELPNAPFPGKQFDKNSILFNEQKAKQHITKLIQTNSLEKGNTHYSSKKKNFDFIQKIMPEKFRIFDYFHQCSSAIQINDQISKEKNSLQQNAFISIENNEIHENNNSSSNINNNNINNSNNNSFNHYLFNRNSNQQQNVFDPLSQNFHTQIQINTILRFGNIQRLKNIKQHVHTRVVQDINLEKIFYENDSNLDSSTVSGKSVIQNPMVSKLRALNKNKSLGSTQIFRSESLSNLSPFKSTLTSKRNSLASLGDSASFINVEDQSQSLAVSRDNSFINIKTNFKTGFNLPSTHQSKKHPSMSESSCTDSIFVKSIEQKLEQISPTKTNLKYLSMKIAPITEQPTSKPRAKFIRIDNSVLEKD